MKTLVGLFFAFLLSVPAFAQQGAYHLQPGDLLDISMWGRDDMRRQVLVLPDGTISYPLAGHINVSNMTVAMAEKQLKDRLVAGGFYIDPQLSVSVADTQGHQVYVIGRVRAPGAIVAKRPLSVMQALSSAGGLDEFANASGIFVIRDDGRNQRTLRLDYRAVSSGRDLASNILLEPGDVVVVPEAGLFS